MTPQAPPGVLKVGMDPASGAVVLQVWLGPVLAMSTDWTWEQAANLAAKLLTVAGVAAEHAGATPDEVELRMVDIELTQLTYRAQLLAELAAYRAVES